MVNGLNTYVISYKDHAGEPSTTEVKADTSYEAVTSTPPLVAGIPS